jgi:hypothetical protein
MPIDPRIALGIQPVQLENPLDAYARVSQVQAMQQRNRLTDLMFRDKERELQQENALAGLYRNAIGADGKVDRSKVLTGAASGGLGAKIPSLQKGFAEQDKSEAELHKIRYEAVTKADAFHRDLLSNVNDPQAAAQWLQATYNDPLLGPMFARARPIDQALAAIPQDPAGFADWKRQSALGATKFIEQNKPTIQTRNLGGTTETMAINPFDGSTKVTNSVKNTMSPDTAATTALGLANNKVARDRLDFDQKQPKGQYDADRGVIVDTRTATATPVKGADGQPIGGKDKLPEAQQKQVIGVQNLSNAIQEYRDELKNFGFGSGLSPDKRALMGTKYNNMMLQAKEAYNLGVLNGPDLEILTSVITDPRSLKGTFTSNETLDKQASELDRIMQGVGKVASQPKPRVDGSKTPATSAGPKAGTVEGGYRFKGGNPADPNSWEKV